MIISQKLSSAIADTLYDNNIISKQEIPIYIYCLDYIIELIFLIVFTILYGTFSHNLPETIIFLIVFIPIRSFGGGFHASTQNRCTLLSLITFIFVLYSDCLVALFTWQWTAAFAISLFLIAILAPVGTKSRPITPDRKKILKKYCIIFCILLSFLYIIFYLKNYKKLYGTLSICILINFVSILSGFIIEKRTKKTPTSNR